MRGFRPHPSPLPQERGFVGSGVLGGVVFFLLAGVVVGCGFRPRIESGAGSHPSPLPQERGYVEGGHEVG